jgi:hypothetical protein
LARPHASEHEGKLVLSSGSHEAQGQYFRIVGPETTTFHLSNGEKEKQVHVFNASDHEQEYVLNNLHPNIWLHKIIAAQNTHLFDLAGSNFCLWLVNPPVDNKILVYDD